MPGITFASTETTRQDIPIMDVDGYDESTSKQTITLDSDDEDGRDYGHPICLDDDDEDEDDWEFMNLTTLRDTDDDVQFLSSRTHETDEDLVRQIAAAEATRKPRKKKKLNFTLYEPKKRQSDHGIHFVEGHPMTESIFLVPGDTVELHQILGSPNEFGDFLKIHEIYYEDDDPEAVFLRGILYRRTKALRGMLPKKYNEVYMVLHQNLDDHRDITTQSLHDVPITSVTGRRCLKSTNTIFPAHSYRTNEDASGTTTEQILKWARLACRWKRIFTYSCQANMETGHVHESSLERITEDECDDGCAVPDAVLRKAVVNVDSNISVVDLEAMTAHDQDNKDLTDQITRILESSPEQETLNDIKNTFADFFCGAGGASIGAREAGLDVKYAVDFDADACASMRLNFPNTEVFHESVYDNLVNRMQAHAIVRCCHMSTVCKTISSAYTVRGKNHDANEATLFCISDILRKSRPMVATLEQTFSALNPNKQHIFNAFVWQFTALGYSVRWTKKTLSDYGLPQARKRLIMIASCPGHPLPHYPKPTHGPGLRPYTTIADAINPIHRGMSNHNPELLKVKDALPYNPDQPLRNCITTSGGVFNWHPSGKRNFTEREYASLQTFPLDHVFAGKRTSVKRQVGNAFPPSFTKLLYESIQRTFLEVDVADAEYEATERADRRRGSSEQMPIHLDDEMIELEDDFMVVDGPIAMEAMLID